MFFVRNQTLLGKDKVFLPLDLKQNSPTGQFTDFIATKEIKLFYFPLI